MKNILFLFISILFFSCIDFQRPESTPICPSNEIEEDKAINIRLPPWSDEPLDINSLDKRNVLSILVNKKNELIVRDKKMDVKNLRTKVKEFISNPNQNLDFAENPKKAIVSLGNERGTDYKSYIAVYNEIKGAYNELRNEKTLEMFGKEFEEINAALQKEIKSLIPLVIVEAEPTAFGEEE